MKTFKETINVPTEKRGFPTFEEMKGNDTVEEAVGVSSKKLQDAIGNLHKIQLDLQTVQNSMLDARNRFILIAKGDPERDPIADELKALNKKKQDLVKKIADAERSFQSALDKEDIEDVDMDII